MMETLADRSFLIVDDEETSRFLVNRFLRDVAPRQLLLASNGQEALDLLATNTVDCIITDLNMRPINGLQLLKAVRTGASAARRDLPVVLFTGYSDIDLVGVALALDVHAFVVKPVAKPVLLARIRRSLEQAAPTTPVAAYQAIEIPPTLGAEPVVEPPPAEARAPVPQPGSGGPEVLLALGEVRENQVLSRDVANQNGRLLINAGTKLTRRFIDRLLDLVEIDPSLAQIWVRI